MKLDHRIKAPLRETFTVSETLSPFAKFVKYIHVGIRSLMISAFQCVRSTVDPKHISQVRPCLRGLTRRQPRSVSSHAGRDHLSTRSKATSTAHIADPKSCAYHENSLSKAGDHDSKNIRYLQKAAQRLDGRTDPSFGIAKPNDGFTTVPRTMPIAKQAIDAQTKGRPAGRTLFGLWARAPDSPSLTATSLCLLPSAQRALEPTMTSLT